MCDSGGASATAAGWCMHNTESSGSSSSMLHSFQPLCSSTTTTATKPAPRTGHGVLKLLYGFISGRIKSKLVVIKGCHSKLQCSGRGNLKEEVGVAVAVVEEEQGEDLRMRLLQHQST